MSFRYYGTVASAKINMKPYGKYSVLSSIIRVSLFMFELYIRLQNANVSIPTILSDFFCYFPITTIIKIRAGIDSRKQFPELTKLSSWRVTHPKTHLGKRGLPFKIDPCCCYCLPTSSPTSLYKIKLLNRIYKINVEFVTYRKYSTCSTVQRWSPRGNTCKWRWIIYGEEKWKKHILCLRLFVIKCWL